MAIARRKRLTFDGPGRSIEYVAPQTITRMLEDGTGRSEVVIVKHERIPFSEAVQRGLMDKTGKVTELGGSNLLDDERAMQELMASSTKKRADTVTSIVVPEHAMFPKDTGGKKKAKPEEAAENPSRPGDEFPDDPKSEAAKTDAKDEKGKGKK